MVDTRHPSSDPQFIFDYLDDSRADGIVALDGSLSSQMLQESLDRSENLQIVFACEWHKSGNYPSVQTDNRQGCRLAIDHLAQLGHTKIGYINGRSDNVLTASRRDDTHEALSDLGLNCVDEWFFDGNFSMEGGVRAAHQFLNLQNRPTAMFCANDETAFGLISELNKHGVSVPDDLSVVGFDDIDISRYFIPALTTIRQPRIELGARAAEMIIDRIQSGGQAGGLPQETLPVELVVRNSTAPV
jgi:LacI family repressor for deo operon, udp, cdd, tsx, nupC, and nupG